MKIYLMRHGAAVEAREGIPDPYRYLSADGRQSCREVGRLLREAEVGFGAALSSPLTRAIQTAELIADAIDYLGVIESHAGLLPGAQPQVVAADILRRADAEAVAVFGHEPTISALAAYLIGQPGFAPFRTAQVCLLEDRKPVWKIRPDALQFQDLHIP
ncbi:phosphohistidine phosphatase SixA [Haliangium sp.]|uniref:phosphohistidine phosphatase SixA n=2 Tax=Haliangium sp. TaxID=2663208 RepID=UPI003D123733